MPLSTINMEGLWAGVASVAAIGATVWGFILKNKTAISETKARVAEDDRDRELANSAHTLYSMMNERLKVVEAEVLALRSHNAQLQRHIIKLEALMRQASIEPPDMEM